MTRRSAVMDPEHRGLSSDAARLTVRESGNCREDGSPDERFYGHAAVFDKRTSIGNPLRWGFYEEIAPGAFTKTLQEGDARFLLDHDSYYVVSRTSASTLNLRQDAIGLEVDSALDLQLSYVKDLKANVRNGNITGMSFGFWVVRDQWSTEEIEVAGLDDPVEVEVRRILEVRLLEVSAVTFPAYEETDAGLRAVTRALRGRGDVDAIRRRMGQKEELDEQLATLLDEPWARSADTHVESIEEEPARTTPRSQEDGTSSEEDGSEPASTTRIAPTERELAAARMRVLRTQLRHAA